MMLGDTGTRGWERLQAEDGWMVGRMDRYSERNHDRDHFRRNYLRPTREAGLIEQTLPHAPKSKLQKYRLTQAGSMYLQKLKMIKKDTKFLSFPLAIQEIIEDFKSDNRQYHLFAKVYSYLVGGKAVPGEEECPPMGIKYGGIWYQPGGLKESQFHNLQEFEDMLAQAFLTRSLSGEDIVKLYTMVFDVKASVGKGPEEKMGIWVETEMEKFKCIQCGHCCLNLYDASCTTAYQEDLIRWEEEGRWDILSYIQCGDLWISPKTGEDVTRCPWLRKLPRREKYICRIHETKPKHCKDYPKSKKHALRTRCKGFSSIAPSAELIEKNS